MLARSGPAYCVKPAAQPAAQSHSHAWDQVAGRVHTTLNRLFARLVSAEVLLVQLVPAAVVGQTALPQAALAQAAPTTTPPPASVVNNPPVAPIQILVFPQRDFVSASGYTADDRVVVTVTHPSGTTFSPDQANP